MLDPNLEHSGVRPRADRIAPPHDLPVDRRPDNDVLARYVLIVGPEFIGNDKRDSDGVICELLNGRHGECVEFSYGGCGGNENNFETQQACEATCDVPTEPPYIRQVPAVSGWSKLMMIGVFLTGLISLSYFSSPLRRRS